MRPGVTLFREGTFRRELGFGAHAASNSHACRRELDPYAHVASNSRARRRILKSGMPRPIRPWPGRGTPMNPHPTRSRFSAKLPQPLWRKSGLTLGVRPVSSQTPGFRGAEPVQRWAFGRFSARNWHKIGSAPSAQPVPCHGMLLAGSKPAARGGTG